MWTKCVKFIFYNQKSLFLNNKKSWYWEINHFTTKINDLRTKRQHSSWALTPNSVNTSLKEKLQKDQELQVPRLQLSFRIKHHLWLETLTSRGWGNSSEGLYEERVSLEGEKIILSDTTLLFWANISRKNKEKVACC